MRTRARACKRAFAIYAKYFQSIDEMNSRFSKQSGKACLDRMLGAWRHAPDAIRLRVNNKRVHVNNDRLLTEDGCMVLMRSARGAQTTRDERPQTTSSLEECRMQVLPRPSGIGIPRPRGKNRRRNIGYRLDTVENPRRILGYRGHCQRSLTIFELL